MPYFDQVVGAAVFDLSGLPKEYFATIENTNMSWVQTIFQALGLRSLLSSSLQLKDFQHVTIYGGTFCAVVVKQRSYYIALLIHQPDHALDGAFIQWAQNCSINELKQNPRFRVA